MKKLIIGLFAAILMGSGLVAFTGGSAVAACPYTGCVDTTTNASGDTSLERGDRPVTTVKVKTDGNATPKGDIKMIYQRVKGGFYRTKTVSYSGGKVEITGPRLKKLGRYTVTAKFIPNDNSVFARSSDSYSLRVRRG
jgi:hypothetical protein